MRQTFTDWVVVPVLDRLGVNFKLVRHSSIGERETLLRRGTTVPRMWSKIAAAQKVANTLNKASMEGQ